MIFQWFLPPKGAIVQVGSKFDVRPSSVCPCPSESHYFQGYQAHFQETDPLLGQLNRFSTA